MSSIIEGYNYDIFISYRQKDNKYDGWVTGFVDDLKKELEATFKEEISVYFDINPHDGLQETHDVDASLKEKLNCLIFVPVISRTYCDPKSFAWVHEFMAFLDQTKRDEFGLKVTLPGGNVANRVLPVRIHDLDSVDIKLFESAVGSALRSVDFVYKETGVNRQLRAKDDDIIKSPGQVLYRDQINKVALAIKDMIESMVSPSSTVNTKGKGTMSGKTGEKKEVVPEEKTTHGKHDTDKKTKPDKLKSGGRVKIRVASVRRKALPPFILICLTVCVAAIILLNHRAEIRWANETALSEIQRFYDETNFNEAFNIAMKAEKIIPENTELKEWLPRVVTRLTVLTDPPRADVYMKKYSDTSDVWKKIGQTPLDSLKMPVATFYRLKIEKAGYETIYAVTRTGIDTLSRKLLKQGTIPAGMVYVDGYFDEVKNIFDTTKGFFLDKYEITNRQYKEFIERGGYRNREYWKNEFIKEGKKIAWEVAISEFTDKTGRQGPSTWEAGDYPDGQDDYPVSGVSWYEAAAYAEFAGKVLPTCDHWDSGAGFYEYTVLSSIGPEIFPLSNFGDKGPAPVGMYPNISCYGALDMAGNVREWNWNETSFGRIISGGGWADENYMFTEWNQLPPFDRSPMNGFRCAFYPDKEKIPVTAFRLIEMESRSIVDYSAVTPVAESIFRIYKNQFLYDKTDLSPKIEERDDRSEDWLFEKVSFNAAYGDERMIAYLFLPRHSSPPFQTLIFFPGSYAIEARELGIEGPVNNYLDFVLKSGRAVVFPVYFRTYERDDGKNDHSPAENHQYTESCIKWVKDFSRTIDYLETRTDINTGKLGFYGHSWGGRLAGIIPAVEDRLTVNILIVGGFSSSKPYPEVDAINYVPRIKIPTLMLNGRYDALTSLKKQVMPFFNNLGTPVADKRLVIYETGHYVTKANRTREILNWCDKYLGHVK